MSMEQSFNLDIVPQKNPPRVKVTEYDHGTDGWLIRAYLFKDGERWKPPTGATVNIKGTTYEKTGFSVTGTVNRGSYPSVTFALTEDMTGYKGLAWAKAVGAESAGSSWYTGMLSSDDVHPSELGAKALAMRTVLDVPELAMVE